MMRRMFRLGLRAGLLAGIVFALVKIMQARRGSQDDAVPSSAWPPVPAPKPAPRPTPLEADEPGMERPAGFGHAATPSGAPSVTATAAPPSTKLEPEPLVAADPKRSTPAPSMTAAPTANAAPSAPGAVTQQPAGRVRPLKATKAPSKATSKATKKAAKETPPADRKWIAPISDDLCPQSHPVKAKLSSRIFHIPGGQNYARCRPDRCYETEQAAQADGFSRSQR